MVNSVRQVDSETPIILDSSSYPDSNTFNKFEPVSDKNVLYSFHIYEPFAYTNLKLNQGNFAYPGHVQSFDAKKVEYWNKDKLKSYIEPVKIFQKRYNIPDYKILAGEFGGHRFSKGLEHYFRDLTSIFN